ncbi:MAG: N-acetylmuramoyl-L-alanine amidase [Eubacterium sp.]|nr:N-acetylmuramoyl-L-alanine amidase [Eubacterium sp.]
MERKRIAKLFVFSFLFCSAFSFLIIGKQSAAADSKSDDEPYELFYDGETHNYTGIRAKAMYNHKKITLNSMDIIKLDGSMYASASDILGQLFGFEVSFNAESGEFSAVNDDISTSISFKSGESSYVKVKKGVQTTVNMNKSTKTIIKNGEDPMPCIRVADLLSGLDCTSLWSASEKLYYIQNNSFFEWTTDAPEASSKINQIYKATGKYKKISDNVGSVKLTFTGDLQSSFDKTTVSREKKVITVTMPSSEYVLSSTLFNKFGEIVKDMTVTSKDNTVKIVFNCEDTTEFTYTTSSKKLVLNLMWDYSEKTGKTKNYSLSILRPEGVFLDQVSNIECYDAVGYKKRFKIIIKGNYVSFYKAHPIIINNNKIKKVKVSKSSSGNTVITVDTKSLQGYKIYKSGKYFVVDMKAPNKIYKHIVILDAGHGGFDNGAVYKKVNEKDLNLKMIYTLMKKYFKSNNGDTKVYWTRMTDEFISLDTRAKFAKKVKANMFISLHMNAAENKKANGTEVYYSVNNNKKNKAGLKSSTMAKKMCSSLVSKLGTVDRGVRTAGFYVIKNNTVPAILVELGFLTGNKDHKKLTDSSFQKKATKTIKNVINSLCAKY